MNNINITFDLIHFQGFHTNVTGIVSDLESHGLATTMRIVQFDFAASNFKSRKESSFVKPSKEVSLT